jgi:polyhydroxybutyrate depolymerase
MRCPLVALALAALLATSAARAAERPTVARSIEVAGVTRSYLLRVPAALGPGPAPLVLVFHGGGGNGPGTEQLTRFSALADREGFLVAYPEGLGRNWNDGREFTSSRAHRERVDDVGFVAALLGAIARVHPVARGASTPPGSPTAASSRTTWPRASPRASRPSRRWWAASRIRPSRGSGPSTRSRC